MNVAEGVNYSLKGGRKATSVNSRESLLERTRTSSCKAPYLQLYLESIGTLLTFRIAILIGIPEMEEADGLGAGGWRDGWRKINWEGMRAKYTVQKNCMQ